MKTVDEIVMRLAEMESEVEAARLDGNGPPDNVGIIVQLLGYKDYKNYRQRALWRKVIRPRILKRDNYKCNRCGAKAKDVHHQEYTEKVMRGEDDNLLDSICRSCHDIVEFDEAGNQRSNEEKRRVFNESPKMMETQLPV
jgi:5-methylcytosine-specific restriction endonuclease McrA